MKLKHFGYISAFLISFLSSVFVVGLLINEARHTQSACRFVSEQTAPAIEPENTGLQIRIRSFLEADRQTGYELSADMRNFRSDSNSLTVEKTATSNLLKKMRAVECKNLPEDFCAAWENHVNAWAEKERFLGQTDKSQNYSSDYLKIEREINQTYYRMLGIAKKYGVYFSY